MDSFDIHGMDLPVDMDMDDMQLLIQATLNEKNAPEILQFKHDLLRRLEQKLEEQEVICEELEQDQSQELRRMMLGLEVRRVRYLIKLYYKTRLQKIEKLAATLMDNEDLQSRLSEKEQSFCHDYFVMVGRHLTVTVLNHLPDDFKGLAQVNRTLSVGQDMIPHVLLDSHVFCKLSADVGSVTLDEGQAVDMHKDDLFMLRYRAIAELVANQQAVLI